MCVLLVALMTLLLPVTGWSATLNVPADHATVQAAIDAAGTGDVVVVQPGVYAEKIDFGGKAITVCGTDPSDLGIVKTTVINGGGAGSVVTFDSGETATSVLQGVKITGGAAAKGAGILCEGASPTIADCLLFENGDGTGQGGGIYCHNSSAVIERNDIEYNYALYGGGIYCESCSPVIRNNCIDGNEAQNGHGGNICLEAASPTIQDNDLTYGAAWGGYGGGIYCGNGSSPIIAGGDISESRGDDTIGGAFCIMSGSTPTITGVHVWYNNSKVGAALYCENATPTVQGCEFDSNSAREAGAHLYIKSCAPIIRNCVVWFGLAPQGGAIYLDNSTGALLENLTLTVNECKDALGTTGVVHGNGGSATLKNSIIAETVAGVGVFVEGGHALSVRYSDVFNTDGNYVGMANPTGANGNLSVNPRLSGDNHLQSVAGRWDKWSSTWETDAVHSRCIDAGDPTSAYANEPAPNGGRINMGAFGNTAEASKSAPPSLAWAGAAGFEADGVDPPSGDPDATTFTFQVEFTDATGAAPKSKRLFIDRREGTKWKTYKNLPLTKVSGDIGTGAVYSCTTTLDNEVVRYQFRFQSVNGTPVTGPPASWTQGPQLNGPPKLYWTGTSGYTADGVNPDSGATTTQFRFRALYLDGEGEAPSQCVLQLRRNGVLLNPKTMAAWSNGDYRLGKTFEKLVTFPNGGAIEYRFEFADADGAATGAPTGWMSGPTIGDGGTALLSGLTPAPTPAGAQVTFSLSGAANVTSTVLNLAGRPVRTLCSDRACEAGPNTLLWNAQSDAGLRVPNGTYLVRVTARTDDGAERSAAARVVVR